MIANKLTRKILCHIQLIILNLSSYPQERIDPFCKGHLDFLNKAPITPEKQVMIDDLKDVYDTYDLGITVKNSDKGKRATFVTKIKEYKPEMIVQLVDITNQINTINHNDKSKIKELHLNEISLFYDGKESEILRYHKELLYNVKLNPDYLSVLTTVKTLVDKVTGLYQVKKDKKDDIKIDITSMDTYVDPLAKVMLKNFNSLQNQNLDNLDVVIDYFPYINMDESAKPIDYTYKNQWIVELLSGQFKNDPRIIFKFTSWLKLQSLGMGNFWVFLSDVPNPTSIPARAVLVKAGETKEFPIKNIGSATELYLIFAGVFPGEPIKFKATVRGKK